MVSLTKDEMIEQLLQQVNSLTTTISAQTALIAQLHQTIQELKEQINKNSKNSSKPPSSDGFKKTSPKSLRKPSEKKAGGQEGHPGTYLAVIADPDDVIGICHPSARGALTTRCAKEQPVSPRDIMSLMQLLQ